jgi:hypothetical protein
VTTQLKRRLRQSRADKLPDYTNHFPTRTDMVI